MKVDRQKLIQRARELAEAEQYEDAWRIVEPLTGDVGSDIDVARLWCAIANLAAPPDEQVAVTATEIIARYPEEVPLVVQAASLLTLVAEERAFDEAPLADGPARIAADALSCVIASFTAAQRDDADIALDVYAELAMALRLTGSQDDQAALDAMNHALRLDPDNGISWFRLGLIHKWRGRWREGVEANRRAHELGITTQGVHWNLAICATGAGDHALAAQVMKDLGMKGEIGEDGVFTGGFEPVQVRVSTLGEGIDPNAHVIGSEPTFENLWIERLSYVHGKIVNASVYDLPVDYGDIVLFDGAAVGWRDDGKTRTPRFPLLQRLRAGAYRRYRFLAKQPRGGFVEALNESLPKETFFYVHDEKVNMLCAQCARSERVAHDHEERESFLVGGKFVVPEHGVDAELAEQLDHAAGDQALLAIPQFFHDLGDAMRARRDEERWQIIESAREEAKHVATTPKKKKRWMFWRKE